MHICETHRTNYLTNVTSPADWKTKQAKEVSSDVLFVCLFLFCFGQDIAYHINGSCISVAHLIF